ncbi:MAG: hypothetical protein WCO68_02345 [Verrucomicrobiota bacterium]
MTRFVLPLLVGACLVVGGEVRALPVDFTPRPYEHSSDGGIYRGFEFIHGQQKVVYLPPPGWTWVGDAAKVSLRPPEGANSARAEFTHTEGTPPPPAWDQAGINVLIQRAQALLPPLAQGVQIADLRQNPIFIDGHETALFVFTGHLYAQTYQFFVLLLPLEKEQFAFVLYAEKKEYEAAATALIRSLGAMRWAKSAP